MLPTFPKLKPLSALPFGMLVFLSLPVPGRELRGVITDCGTGEPLPAVNVYLEGTYQGVSTDFRGCFALPVPRSYQGVPVVISAIGYENLRIATEKLPAVEQVLCLRSETYELSRVEVRADDLSREDKLAMFRQAFLGASAHGAACTILNPDDLVLWYDLDRRTLRVRAKAPVRIHNAALGYYLDYHLEEFTYGPEGTEYYGPYFFRPDSTLSGGELRQAERRRRRAYYGSRMHFVRSLYSNKLTSNNFRMVAPDEHHPLHAEDVCYQADGFRYLADGPPLEVYYLGGNHNDRSQLHPRLNALILPNGFYDARCLRWSGWMAQQRVGDLLPLEYKPE